jgi:hypothetical protein
LIDGILERIPPLDALGLLDGEIEPLIDSLKAIGLKPPKSAVLVAD